ncbi:MAG: hypothetical protein JWN15_2723 [Firmicutes bacterium]|jgi:hypothetical protein|nr:hypothetical protein [Bacillota bacterium]
MANQEIYCTVESCYYYGKGDVCKATKILVKNNPATLRNAGTGSDGKGGQAHDPNETLCDTFVREDQGPKAGIGRIDD